MAVYTVHQPPLGKGENTPDPARFTFVRDGFYVWGFLLSVLWMLRHRLWLVAVLFVAISVLLEVGLRYAGVTSGWRGFVFVALQFLVGLEGATLRRWTLARRGPSAGRHCRWVARTRVSMTHRPSISVSRGCRSHRPSCSAAMISGWEPPR